MDKAGNSFNGAVKKTGSSFKEFVTGATGLRFGMAALGQAFSGTVAETNDYIETTNYAAQVLGDFYPQAKQYAERIQELMGVDSKDFLEAQTSFMTMAQGFGLAAQKSYDLSKGLTELGYDISSITNTDTATVFQRLQSAIAGEIEPVRRWGVALDQASMKEWLMKKGLDSNVSSMNQASKALIRYNMLVETMNKNGVIGDMARTLQSPANAIRILKQQITQLARAIGSIFIPILTMVLPYIQAFVSVLTKAIRAIAGFFGIKLPDWSKDSGISDLNLDLEDTTDTLGKATKKAKEFKKQLMGFDELNIINVPNESTSGSGSNNPTADITSGLDIPSVWDEAMLSQIQNKVKALETPMKVILGLVGAIGIGFLGWRIKQALIKHFAMPAAPGTFMYGITKLAGMITSNPIFSKGLAATLFKGNPLATVAAFAGGIILLVGGFIDLVKNNEKFKKGLTGLQKLLGTAKKKVSEFFKSLGIKIDLSSLDSLSESINKATNGWVSLGDAAVIFGALLIGGGPLAIAIGIGVALIKGIGFAFEEVTDKSGKSCTRIQKAVNDLKEWIRIKVDFICDKFEAFGKTVEKIPGTLKDAVGKALKTAGEFVKDFKTEFSAGLSGLAKTVKEKIKLVMSNISNGIKDRVQFVKDSVAGVKNAITNGWDTVKNKVKEKWGKIRDVFTLSNIASKLKSGVNSIISVIERLLNRFVTGINTVIDGVNKILGTEIAGHRIGFTIGHVPTVSLPRVYAAGGFPEEGPFFMNRGEIAGKFANGKGVVANNMQIIEGISKGVQDGIIAGYRYANMNAPTVRYDASSLAEQMTANGQNRDQNITVTLNVDGQEMAKKVFKIHNSTVKQTGHSPLMI